MIDWLSISANIFGNKFSPRECIFEFLKLPISQSLALNIESKETAETTTAVAMDSSQPIGAPVVCMDKSKAFKDEYPAKGTMSVFNDAGNPLLSQVAIFARLLEQSQIEKRNSINPNYPVDPHAMNRHSSIAAQQPD